MALRRKRDKNKKQELEKIEEITSVSDEEEANIEQEVNSPDLFNTYTVNKAVGGGAGTVKSSEHNEKQYSEETLKLSEENQDKTFCEPIWIFEK